MSILIKTESFLNLNELNEFCKSNAIFGDDFLHLTRDNGNITFTFEDVLQSVLDTYETELDIVLGAYSDPADPHSEDMPVTVHTSTSDPTADDDIEKGYEAGCCHWLNTSNSKYFICKVSTAGAAVWDEVQFS